MVLWLVELNVLSRLCGLGIHKIFRLEKSLISLNFASRNTKNKEMSAPLIQFDASGQASILNYSLPQPNSLVIKKQVLLEFLVPLTWLPIATATADTRFKKFIDEVAAHPSADAAAASLTADFANANRSSGLVWGSNAPSDPKSVLTLDVLPEVSQIMANDNPSANASTQQLIHLPSRIRPCRILQLSIQSIG